MVDGTGEGYRKEGRFDGFQWIWSSLAAARAVRKPADAGLPEPHARTPACPEKPAGRFLQRHVDIPVWIQEKRHLGQARSHGEMFQVRHRAGPGDIRRQRERFGGRHKVGLVIKALPDRSVHSLGIVWTGPEQVDQQQMNPVPQRRFRLVRELRNMGDPILVRVRHDLAQSNDPMAADMADRQGTPRPAGGS
jgi:hypothetical protein